MTTRIEYTRIDTIPADDPPDGLVLELEAAGIRVRRVAGLFWEIETARLDEAKALVTAYNPLPAMKKERLERLREILNQRLDWEQIIIAGTSTSVTGANLNTYFAGVVNRTRTLMGQVRGAATPAAVRAVDFTSGWPTAP